MSNVRDVLKDAIRYIDEAFGTGYAKAHPELVASFIHGDAVYEAAYAISRSIDGVAENIRSEDAVRQQLGPLAVQQAGRRVQAIDRFGCVVADAYEDERRRCRAS